MLLRFRTTVDRRQQMTPPQPGIGTNKPLGAGADAAPKPQRTQALTADPSRQDGGRNCKPIGGQPSEPFDML